MREANLRTKLIQRRAYSREKGRKMEIKYSSNSYMKLEILQFLILT